MLRKFEMPRVSFFKCRMYDTESEQNLNVSTKMVLIHRRTSEPNFGAQPNLAREMLLCWRECILSPICVPAQSKKQAPSCQKAKNEEEVEEEETLTAGGPATAP